MNRRLLIIGGAGIALMGLIWILTRGGDDPRPEPAIAAIVALEGGKDVEGLAAAVSSPDDRVARRAVQGLRNVGGSQAARRIQPALSDARKTVRHAGVVQIGMLGPDGGESVPLVGNLIRTDKEPEVRAAAVTSLGDLLAASTTEPLTVVKIEPIAAALDDANAAVRRSALASLESLLRVRYQQFKPDGLPGERQGAVRGIRSVLADNVAAWNSWRDRLRKEGKIS